MFPNPQRFPEVSASTVPSGDFKIDWKHPLTRGLVGAFVPGRSLACYVTGYKLGFTSSSKGIVSSAVGPALNCVGTSSGAFSNAKIPASWAVSSTTLFALVDLKGAAGQANSDFFTLLYNSNGASPFAAFSLSAGPTSPPQISGDAGGGWSLALPSQPSPGLHTICGATNTTRSDIYLDGISAANDAGHVAPTYGTTPSLSLGTYGPFASTKDPNLNMGMALLYNRKLADDEVLQLHLAPFSIFRPTAARTSRPTVAGTLATTLGGATLTAAAGRGWFVDGSVGSNGNGQSWGTAWKTLANIVWTSISAGDTIYISGGSSGQTYSEQFVIGKSGSAGAPITITPGVDTGHNGQVTIDCATVSGSIGVYNGGFNYVTVQNLYVQNVGECGFKVDSSTAGVLIQNCHIYTGVGNGSAANCRGFEIKNCSGTNAVTVKNNFVTTPSSSVAQTDGIYSENNSGALYIGNSVIISNTDPTNHSDGIQTFNDISVEITGNFISHPNGGFNNHGLFIENTATGGTVKVNNNVVYMPVGDESAIRHEVNTAGWTGKGLYYNNTVFGGYPSFYLNTASTTTEVKNNIVYPAFGRPAYMLVGTTVPASGNIDYNLVYGPNNGNLRAYCVASAGTGMVRSTTSQSTGKWYFEATVGTWAGGNSGIGIANATQSLATWVGASGNNSAGYFVDGGLYINGSKSATYQTYSGSQTLAFAVDVTNKRLWVKNLTSGSNWNNSGTANPATNVGGFLFSAITGPYFVALSSNSQDDSATFSFGASAFAGTVPSGFSAWGSAATLNPSDLAAPITTSIQIGINTDGTLKNWSAWQTLGYDTHGVNADPLFADAASQNFHIGASSPAKNAGTSTGIAIDYDSIARDASPDIGAFEVAPQVSGTLAATVGAALAAAGSVDVSGGLSATAGAALAANASTRVEGTLGATCGATLAAIGSPVVEATMSQTADASVAAAGAVLVGGALGQTCGATLSADGTVAISGSLSDTLDGSLISAAGGPVVVGALAATAGANLAAAAGPIVAGGLSASASAAIAAAASTSVQGSLNAISAALQAQLFAFQTDKEPRTQLHYAAGNSSNVCGFNLADVSSLAALQALPAGMKGLVFYEAINGADAAFKSFVDSFVGATNLWGFYLADEPDPTGTFGHQISGAQLKAASDYVHSTIPGAKTFIAMMNGGSPMSPEFYTDYAPANTGIDYFGFDPYPIRPQADQPSFKNGENYDVIPLAVQAAIAAGYPTAQQIPIYQTFGGGGYPSWTLPTPDQLRKLIKVWGQSLPAPAFDYAYAWGQQLGDTSLSMSPALQAVMTEHNEAAYCSLEGTASATLAAAGGPIVAGAASVTCANATLEAGTDGIILGSLSATTAASLSAAAATTVAASLSATASATLAATAGPVLAGTLSATTASASLSAVASVPIQGAGAATLGSAAISSAAAVAVAGAASVTLAAATLSAGSDGIVFGSLAATAGAALSAAARSIVAGNAAIALSPSALAAAAGAGIAGSLSSILAPAALAAAASAAIVGSANSGLDDATLNAAGTIGDVCVGTLTLTLSSATITAAGELTIAGHASLSLDAASIAAAGELAELGGLTAALDDAMITATADVVITGQLARSLDPAALAADGGPANVGALSRALDQAALSATGTVFSTITGTLTVTLGQASLSGRLSLATIGGPAVVPAPPPKLGGDRIQARVWRGYAKAAQHLGSWHDIYRPRGAKNPLSGVNRWGKIAVSLDAKPYKFDAPNLYGKPVWYALLDGGLVQVGDYLINQKTLQAYFVAALQSLLPIAVVECNETLDVFRPSSSDHFGASREYSGDTVGKEVRIMTGWPASVLAKSRGERGDTNLPGDVRMPWFEVLLPAVDGVSVEFADVLMSDSGHRYKIGSAERSDLGWRCMAALAQT